MRWGFEKCDLKDFCNKYGFLALIAINVRETGEAMEFLGINRIATYFTCIQHLIS